MSCQHHRGYRLTGFHTISVPMRYAGQYMHLLRDTCIISYIILLNPAVSGGGVVIRNIDEELDIELVTFKHAT